MTSDPTLTQVIERWLGDGPTDMPDRVVAVVAQRIARQGQRPAWRLRPRRLPTMSTPFRLAAVVAALLALLIGGTIFLGGGGRPVPAPSPTPSPSPSASPLTYAWPRALAAGTYRTTLSWDLPFEVEFTVPEGWQGYDIEISKPGAHGLAVEFVLVENIFSDPCTAESQNPSIGPSVDDLSSAIATLPGLDVVGPTRVDVDRLTTGASLEYTLREDADCEPSAYMLWDMPMERILPVVPSGGDRKALTAREGRIWILDVDGERLVMRTTWDPESTQAERDELQAIVDSVGIVRPDASPPPQPAAP